MATRRQFVFALAATTATAALGGPPAAAEETPAPTASAPAPAGPGAAFVVADGNSIEFVSGDLATRSSMPLVSSVQLQVTAARALRVVASYDARLFSAGDVAIVALGEQYEVATVAVDETSAPAATLSYDVPDLGDAAAAATITIGIPLTVRPDRYPDEGVDAPLPLVVTVSTVDGVELARARWDPVTVGPTVAWGAEITATWAATRVVDAAKTRANQYRYPASLICSSVGPHSVPAGTTITIDLDASVFAACSVARIAVPAVSSASVGDVDATTVTNPMQADVVPTAPEPWAAQAYSVATSTEGGVLRTVVALNQEIPVASAIEVVLAIDERVGDPTLTAIVYATASLAGPADPAAWQRTTGKYITADLSDSGTPLVPGVAEGKI